MTFAWRCLLCATLLGAACVDADRPPTTSAAPDAPSDIGPAKDAGSAPSDSVAAEVGADPAVALFEDEDGDGLTGIEELEGWEIFVDFSGFSLQYADFLTRSRVVSDPFVADTDGDGLLDGEEFLLKTDPTVVDTDGDGLSDRAEVRRWQSSPVSVDSDADSRDAGAPFSQPPDPMMFDGAELQLVPDPLDPTRMIPGPEATSPILKDSDGDGVDDRDEYRHAFRSASVAEVPTVDVAQVDGLDIRLDVTYAETQGTQYSYGGKLATTDTTVSSKTVSYSNTTWSSATVEVGASASIGIPTGVTLSAGETTTTGMSTSKSVTFDDATSTSVSQSHSEFFKDSVGRTMTTQGGHITASVRVANPTAIAYVIDGLGLTLRQAARPGGEPRTLGALLPAAGFDGFGMGPYSESPVIPFFAEFDTGTLLDVMAAPDSLVLEPIGFQLTNVESVDFVFVTEEVAAVTGGLVIDAGDGAAEQVRIAAVDRTDEGKHAGYRLSHALDLLDKDWEAGTNSVTGKSLLARIGDKAYEVAEDAAPELGDPEYPEGVDPGPRMAVRFWSVLGGSRGEPVDLDRNFEALSVGPGQELVLAYVQDLDRDGVIDRVEELRGASDEAVHSDATEAAPTGDGLSDFFEIMVGWNVVLEPTDPLAAPPEPYRVFPHPSRVDTDGDGWNDRDEYDAGTDPTLQDTDGDSMPDPSDPEPLKWFNDGPTVSATVVDNVLDATLTITADDAQNNIDVIIVDWGDSGPVDRLEYRAAEVRSGLQFDLAHSYADDGTYPITVTVLDMFGLTATATTDVDVLSVPKGAVLHWDFNPPWDECMTDGGDAPGAYLDRWGGPNACFRTSSTGNGNPFLAVGNPAWSATQFTWSFWIRVHYASTGGNVLAGIRNYPLLVYHGAGPNAGKIEVAYSNVLLPYLEPGNFWNHFSNDGFGQITNGQVDGWHHVAITFEATNPGMFHILYIDGVWQGLKSTPGFNYNPVGCTMYFGGADWPNLPDNSPCFYFDYFSEMGVTWDDVRVYDRLLTPDEIQLLFNEGP